MGAQCSGSGPCVPESDRRRLAIRFRAWIINTIPVGQGTEQPARELAYHPEVDTEVCGPQLWGLALKHLPLHQAQTNESARKQEQAGGLWCCGWGVLVNERLRVGAN